MSGKANANPWNNSPRSIRSSTLVWGIPRGESNTALTSLDLKEKETLSGLLVLFQFLEGVKEVKGQRNFTFLVEDDERKNKGEGIGDQLDGG